MPSMIRRSKGHIVAISSMSGIAALGRAVTYSASKFAVRGFMEALREDLRLDGLTDQIQTTTIFPYFIVTRKDMIDQMRKTEWVGNQVNWIRLLWPSTFCRTIAVSSTSVRRYCPRRWPNQSWTRLWRIKCTSSCRRWFPWPPVSWGEWIDSFCLSVLMTNKETIDRTPSSLSFSSFPVGYPMRCRTCSRAGW